MIGESGMGWVGSLWRAINSISHDFDETPDPESVTELHRALLAMPAPARIALARELLAGTGRVVARDVYVPERYPSGSRARDGWNACRAAMMEDGK